MASKKRATLQGKTIEATQQSAATPPPVAPGWKQFLTSRKHMLDSYDRAMTKARGHEIETFQGIVAEAEFRKWLFDFLPKRFSVTPGYIVSQRLGTNQKLPHFDVIIYDALNSPVLWVDEHPDASLWGSSRAIPAEYVFGVLEVKSSLNARSAKQAITHLSDLAPFLEKIDAATERYKCYLPPQFFCGVVFFELKREHMYSRAAIFNLLKNIRQIRGFAGGIILRGEGHSKPWTGRIHVRVSRTPMPSFIGPSKKSLLDNTMCGSIPLGDNLHVEASPYWAESAFADFAFDLVALMQGTYQPGRVSSFYGFGSSDYDPDVR